MSGTLSTVSAEREIDEELVAGALRDLADQAAVVDSVERRLSEVRVRRDQLIRRAVGQGASERAAASSARVSPSYAHAAAKNGGLTASVLREERTLRARTH
jgi:hypothetical protein